MKSKVAGCVVLLILGGFIGDYFGFEILHFVLSLLIIYSAIVIGVGTFGRVYLKGKEDRRSLDLYATKVNYLLVLSGFALAVLIFLMGPINSENSSLDYRNTVLIFFTTSFFIFIIAFKLTDFEYYNLVYYLTDILTDLGLLTLAGGFVLLICERISHSMELIGYFGLPLLFTLIIYGKYRWYKYMRVVIQCEKPS